MQCAAETGWRVMEPAYDSRDLADALESAVLAFLRVPPIRQALYDLLRTYGLSAQLSELFGVYHEQMQAIVELMTLVYARLIEHDKRAIEVSKNTLIIMQRQAARMAHEDALPDSITQVAADALETLHAEAGTLHAAMDDEAARVQALIAALHAARADVARDAAEQ